MGPIFTIEVPTQILTNNKKSVWGKFRKNLNIISNNFIIVLFFSRHGSYG